MIDDRTKKDLLAELAKSGNAYFACAKTNISRATYYRWRKEDERFRRASDKALRLGRHNMVDIAEQALMQKVKEKDLGAIKYLLAHNAPRYRPGRNPSQVVLRHVRDEAKPKVGGEDPAERFFKRMDEMVEKEQGLTPEQLAAIEKAAKNLGID